MVRSEEGVFDDDDRHLVVGHVSLILFVGGVHQTVETPGAPVVRGRAAHLAS